MGIRLTCPNGHKLHVKAFLAGKRGICPHCGISFLIPLDHGLTTPTDVPQAAPSLPRTIPPIQQSKQDQQLAEGSPSVVIAVAVSPTATEPKASTRNTDSPPTHGLPPKIEAQPKLYSPQNYVYRREARRRKQWNLTLALLLTVFVLALILFWILSR
jgi:hypothetical protein